MSRRIVQAIGFAALAAFVTSCTHDQRPSITETARAACEQQQVAAGAAMEACIRQMSESIANARSYRPEPARPAPSQQAGTPRR